MLMKYVKVTVTVTIIAIVGVVLFFFLTNRDTKKDNDNDTTKSFKDEILNKDVENNYPVTVREVIILFNNIQKCYYNENINEEDIDKLADMAWLLFDDKLKETNPYEKYISDLKTEITEYKDEKRVIERTVVDKGSDVEYVTIDGIKNASIEVVYYMKDAHGTRRVTETYILRKNSEDKWKIYSWGIVQS